MTWPPTRSGAPSNDLIPFSRRTGLSTSEWSTSSIAIVLRSAATLPGEAAAHGDARPALHGLLEPARCARDELVRRLVEQKERSGVAPERVADADEQLVEQLVELEVREGGIRDRLDAPELILLPPPRDVHHAGSLGEL